MNRNFVMCLVRLANFVLRLEVPWTAALLGVLRRGVAWRRVSKAFRSLSFKESGGDRDLPPPNPSVSTP